MARSMVKFSDPQALYSHHGDEDTVEGEQGESTGSAAGLGLADRRAAARVAPGASLATGQGITQVVSDVFQPAGLPAGWRRIWHPTSGRRRGYASFVGPEGQHARSMEKARAIAQGHGAGENSSGWGSRSCIHMLRCDAS